MKTILKSRVFLWGVISIALLTTCAAVLGYIFFTTPSQSLSAILTNDLRLEKTITEAESVHAFQHVQLYGLDAHRADIVLFCVTDKSSYRLGTAVSHSYGTKEVAGGRWFTRKNDWIKLESWPQQQDWDKFRQANPALIGYISNGFSPRTHGMETFRAREVKLCVSEQVSDYDCNKDIDSSRLATIMLDPFLTQHRPTLRTMTVATFQNPHWFSATDALVSVRKSVESAELQVSYDRKNADHKTNLNLLRTLENHLSVIEARGEKVYFLASDPLLGVGTGDQVQRSP